MTKADLIKKIDKISCFDKKQVEDFRYAISISEIDSKSRNFLYKALDLRESCLNSRESFLIEMSEIKEDEYE